MSKTKWSRFYNSISRFIIVGSCSTGIDFCIYMLLSLKIPITISKGISMICSSVFSYLANKLFTFKNREKTDLDYLIRFYAVFAASFSVNMGVNYIVYNYTQRKFVAYAFATAFGMIVNYLGQRFIVFKEKKSKSDKDV